LTVSIQDAPNASLDSTKAHAESVAKESEGRQRLFQFKPRKQTSRCLKRTKALTWINYG
jgi:hypothetical protein